MNATTHDPFCGLNGGACDCQPAASVPSGIVIELALRPNADRPDERLRYEVIAHADGEPDPVLVGEVHEVCTTKPGEAWRPKHVAWQAYTADGARWLQPTPHSQGRAAESLVAHWIDDEDQASYCCAACHRWIAGEPMYADHPSNDGSPYCADCGSVAARYAAGVRRTS